MLIEAGEIINAIALDRTAHRESELVLGVLRLERYEGRPRRKRAVAPIVEDLSVKVVGPGFGDHIDHCSAAASLLGGIGIR